MYSCHIFLISSAALRSIQFLSFIESIFAWNVPLVSLIFLKRSPDCTILLFSSISLHWSLSMTFLCFLAIHWNSAFKWVYLLLSPLPFSFLLFTAIWRLLQTTILPFCISFPGQWCWPLPPVQCHNPLPIVLLALSLSVLIPLIYLSLPLYNSKWFDLGHTQMV